MNKAILSDLLNRSIENSSIPLGVHLRIVNSINAHLARQASLIKQQENEIARRKIERGIQGIPGIGIPGEKGKTGKPGKNIKGEDGKTVINEKIIQKIVDNTVPTKKLVEAVIEKIKKDKPIDISHIRNFQSFIMDKTSYKVEELMHGGGGISQNNIMDILSGTIDNVNKTFTFKRKPIVVVVNGATYRNGAGVIITNTTVILDNAIGTGGDIYALG